MILAAGKGTRMRPLTDLTPKPLLKVAGQPLLIHHINSLLKAGISEIAINTHYLGQQIISTIGDGSNLGVKIKYFPEESLLDTGGGIVNALSWLGSEPFLVISADILTNYPLVNLPTLSSDMAHLVMVNNPSYHPEGDFALEHGRLKLSGTHKYTYANIGIFHPEFFADAPSGAFPLSRLLKKHISNNLISGEHYSGAWFNIGTPADLELANNL